MLPNPLPAVQIDRALFGVGDRQVVPQIDMSPDVYNQHVSAFSNTMTHEGEVGELISFGSNSAHPVQRFLARHE